MSTPTRSLQHIGAHMSIAGGLEKSIERIQKVQGTALQIFTKNQRQWKFPPLREATIHSFQEAWFKWGPYPVVAHDSYLINLASPDEILGKRSLWAFIQELIRVEKLHIPWLITHPGAHRGQGVEKGLDTYVQNLDKAITLSKTETVGILLETTAGQGTVLGSTFEELGEIIHRSVHGDRLGICLDTCHIHGAGYGLSSEEGYEKTFQALQRTIGLDKLGCIHVNDSKHKPGSRLDRHEHIGKGRIGLKGFSLLLNDRRLRAIPKILETPKSKGLEEDRQNLKTLYSLLGGNPEPPVNSL